MNVFLPLQGSFPYVNFYLMADRKIRFSVDGQDFNYARYPGLVVDFLREKGTRVGVNCRSRKCNGKSTVYSRTGSAAAFFHAQRIVARDCSANLDIITPPIGRKIANVRRKS